MLSFHIWLVDTVLDNTDLHPLEMQLLGQRDCMVLFFLRLLEYISHYIPKALKKKSTILALEYIGPRKIVIIEILILLISYFSLTVGGK